MKQKRKDPKKWAKKWLRSGWKVKNTDQKVSKKYAKNYDLIDWNVCSCANPIIVVKNNILYCNKCGKKVLQKQK